MRPSSATLLMFALIPIRAIAQPKYDPGATGAEIKIGNIMPYTGAFSEYGATGCAEAAYFQMVNDQGSVNGRKIKFISLDSGSDTNKAIPHFPWTVLSSQQAYRRSGLHQVHPAKQAARQSCDTLRERPIRPGVAARHTRGARRKGAGHD